MIRTKIRGRTIRDSQISNLFSEVFASGESPLSIPLFSSLRTLLTRGHGRGCLVYFSSVVWASHYLSRLSNTWAEHLLLPSLCHDHDSPVQLVTPLTPSTPYHPIVVCGTPSPAFPLGKITSLLGLYQNKGASWHSTAHTLPNASP